MGIADFFRPRWKHADPAVRAGAIRALGDDQQDVLLAAALEDGDPGNRLLAARRVRDLKALRTLRDGAQDKNVRDWARAKSLERLAATAMAPPSGADGLGPARAALEEIGDDARSLEAIALGAAALDIRKLAFPKLVHAGAIHALAMGETDETLALAALAKLSKPSHFESLAKNAKCKAVRKAARDKLDFTAEAKKPDPGSVNRAKLKLAFSAAENAAASASEPPPGFPWEAAAEKVDEAENALRELMEAGVIPEMARLSRFRDDTARFRTLYARIRESREEREKKARDASENLRLKDALCLQLEGMPAADLNVETDAGDPLRGLREQFQAIGPAPEGREEELQRRFRAALGKRERERDSQTREKEYRLRREDEEKEHAGKLSVLCEEAESLAGLSREKPEQGAERLRSLRKEWRKALQAAGGFDGKQALVERFDGAAAVVEASLEQLRAEHLKAMREILPRLEALLESPDMLAAEAEFKKWNSAWKKALPPPLGPEADALQDRYHGFLERYREAQDWWRWSNLRAKQAICDQLEALLTQEDRKAMTAGLKELQAEWKSLGPVSWDSSEALWDRYHQICDQLYEKCREYFAELEEEREGNLKAKEELCARVEAIVGSQFDWREAMDAVREAQGNWKSVGAVPRAQSEALWNRFRAACDVFFEKRDQFYRDNLAQKSELAALAESLQESTAWKATGNKLKEAHERWKAVGPLPRKQADTLWGRFHAACERFYAARRAHFENLEQERPQNLARKEALCLQMEGLDALATDDEKFERIRAAQAEWKEIGLVPKENEDSLWERFRAPIDAYFETRKGRFAEGDKLREENAKIKEDICVEAESLIESRDWKASIEKIKSLQGQWKASGPAPRPLDQKLWKRFRTACDAFFDRLKEDSAQRNEEREVNLQKKEDLCFLAESLGRSENGAVDWKAGVEKIKDLQQEWKKIGPAPREHNEIVWERFRRACDAIFDERRQVLGLQPEDPQANLEKKLALIAEAEDLAHNPGGRAAQTVQELRREWKRVGAVPRAQADYVWDRFNKACDEALSASAAG